MRRRRRGMRAYRVTPFRLEAILCNVVQLIGKIRHKLTVEATKVVHESTKHGGSTGSTDKG